MAGKTKQMEAGRAETRGLWSAFLVLVLLVLGSGIGVVYSTHNSRHLLNELQQLEEQRNGLQVEWGQLLLEQSSMVSQGRIEEIAITELGMEVPQMNDVVVVRK